ncbi:MAG: hypothetical protein JNK94_04500 [Hyphomonadaceae bacterium]|nr:hypothetical protein [Hyphomonadaceae bacterium]
MRRFMFALAFAVAACGEAAAPSGEAAAQGGAAASGGQAAFVQACTAALTAENPQAARWAPEECAARWDRVVAAGPMAEAILAAAAGGPAPRAGQFGPQVEVTANASARTFSFGWQAVGEPIPYDLVGALRERGAALGLIGCAQVGTGEFNRVYSVTAAGGRALQLNIYERTAPTGDAFSAYGVETNLTGRVQTLAQLRSDGSEWVATECTY